MSAPRKTKPRSAAPKGAARAVPLSDALADAAWTEADRGLAQALAEMEQVEAATNQIRRAEALLLLRQALARAARTRGLVRIGGEVGEVESYDPARHELMTETPKPPTEVMVVAQGVGRAGEVLVKARVRAVRKRPS